MNGKKSIRRFVQRWIRPSTIEFIREARRVRRFSLFDTLHGYVYGRWTYLYIGLGTGHHPQAHRLAPLLVRVEKLSRPARRLARQGIRLGRRFHLLPRPAARPLPAGITPSRTVADTYHGKVIPLQAATQLVMINEPVRLENLEKVIPYPRARDIILNNPDHLVALDCPCRLGLPNPCLPLDVCLIVGEPFASFVIEHHPDHSRWISSLEAVAILEAEDARGHVHHAFFKDAMLDRFYAICNCCACCCGAMQAQRNGSPMLASSGFVAQVDEDLCIGCETCHESCQFGALRLEEFVTAVDQQACMGCGICVSKCEYGALSLRRDPARGEPLEILSLINKASALVD